MAVNIVRKSKNEDEEEKRKQLLAQMQENSQARKNAEIQAVKNSNVKFNNPYLGGGTYLAGKYVSGLGEGTTNIVSAPMQTLALGFQQGSKQASKEQTTWDKIKNIGKNTFKTFAYADPTMITRLMYDTTVGRDEFIQNANEVNTQIQQNASQADSTWKKATAYLGGYGSYIQKQYLNSGLNQLQTGAQSVGQVLGSEKSQQASQALLQADDKLHEPIDKLNEELSKSEGAQNKVIRRLGNASYTIGNMTPSILISALSGGAGASDATREALSLTSMGISAKGGSTREGLKQGLDLSTAERIGVSKGMVEVGTEKMWNGLSFLKSPDSKVGSAIRTWIGKQVEDRIKSQFGKTVLTKWIPDLAGESLEEFVSGIYDNWLDRATVDPNRGNFFKEQSLDTLIDTTLSTLLMNAPSYVLETKAIHDRNKSGNQTNVNTEESNGYKQNLQEMVNNLNIPNEMKAELQQTIDSNETITGEEYNNTRERIKSLVKQNTQQQIDSLSNDLNNQYIDIGNRLSELDNIKAENFKDPESRRFYAQQINKEFGDTTLDSILAGYPENRNGNRTVKQYKEIAKEYGKQMAENGLTFDEVRANTVGAWQYYEPNKNITRYDNQQKKNASFERLNSQVWSEEIYNSYKDTMRTQLQQQQEALSTQMNDELTRLQDEENILIDTIDNLKPRIEAVKNSLVQSAEQYGYKGKQISEIQDLMKRRGINAYFDETQFNNDSEGAFYNPKTNEIVFNPNASQDQVIQELAVHEWYHDLKAKGQGEEIQQSVIDFLKNNKNYQDLRKSLENAYAKLTDPNTGEYLYDIESKEFSDMIDEEATAKTLQRVLGNETEIQRLINYKPSLARRIYDAVVDLLNKFTGGRIEKLYWQDVRNKFESEFNKAGISTNEEKARYSVKENRQYLQKQFEELTGDSILRADAKLAGREVRNKQRQAGNLEGEMEALPYNEEAMNLYKKIKSSVKSSNYLYHSTPADRLQSIIENGLTIGNKQNQEGVSSKDKLYLSASEELANSFTPNDSITFRINPNAKLENLDSDLLGGEGAYTITNNIPPEMLQVKENGKWVRLDKSELAKTNSTQIKATDNQGRTLTKEQQEYFKDVSPELKDENGNLKVMYHGSSENFTEFDLSKLGQNTGDKIFGIWTTSDKNYASQYASKNLIEGYVQINKPLSFEGKTIDIDDFSNMLSDFADKIGKPILKNKEATQRIYNNSVDDVDFYTKITQSIPKSEWTNFNLEMKNKLGYDGIILENSDNTIAVAFESNQIKNVDNLNPTENPDIRYSKKTKFDEALQKDNQGRTLTKEQQEYFKDSKVRDENGNLLEVYHGTKTNGINVFKYNPKKQTGTDYGKAFYFTTDYTKAQGYQYNVENDPAYIKYNEEYNKMKDYAFEEGISEEEKDRRIKELSNWFDNNSIYDIMNDENYTPERMPSGETKKLYLNITNPYTADAKGKYYYEVYDKYFEEARKNNNDGIIVKNVIDVATGEHRPIDVYIAFNENQIKNVDNKAPTTNSDIRYNVSLSNETNNDGEKLSNGQVNYFANSKARDNQGNLEVVYHTTGDHTFIDQFNEFDPRGDGHYKFGNQIVNYYTDNQVMSGSYGKLKHTAVDTRKIENIRQAQQYAKENNFTLVKNDNGIYTALDTSSQRTYDNAIKYLKENLNDNEINELFRINQQAKVDEQTGKLTKLTPKEDALKEKVWNTVQNMREKLDDGYSFLDFLEYQEITGGTELKGRPEAEVIATFKSKEDLLKNIVPKTQGSGIWQYSGYTNIQNPYIVDAKEANWNQIKEGISKYGQQLLDKIDVLEDNKLYYPLKRIYDKVEFESKKASDRFNEAQKKANNEQYGILGYLARDGNLDNLINSDLYTQEEKTKMLNAYNTTIDGKTLEEIGLDLYNNKYSSLWDKKIEEFKKENPIIKDFSSEDLDVLAEHYEGGRAYIETRYSETKQTNEIVQKVIDYNNSLFGDTTANKRRDSVIWADVYDNKTNRTPEEILSKGGYDGIIIKNVIDYGFDVGSREPGNLYITFGSEQFKAKDNLNPTMDRDIRYSEDTNFDDWANNNLPSLGEGKTTLGELRTEQPKLPVKQPETTQPILPTQQNKIANDYIKFRELTEQVKNGDITEAEFDRLSNLDDIQQELKDLGRTDEQVKNTIAELANLRDNQLNEQDINNLINLMGMNAYDREVARNKIAKGETLLPTTKKTQTISSTIEEPTLKVPVPKGNTGTEQKVAKVLSEPITKVKPEQRAWALFKANILDKGAVFEDLSFKSKNRELQAKWDSTLLADAKGQNAIGQARYEFENGEEKQVSKALTDIIDEVGENSEDFNNYMYHQLNIDRMTLEDRFDIANKPVFGDGIDANYSKQKVAELEKAHPEFKEYAQDVYDYLDTNKKELVDNGVISQETSDKFKEMYPHYVPIARIDAKGQAINVPLDTNRTGVNSPIKRAKGGSQDIQPLFQTIADRTMQTYKASSRNSFGLELKNTLNNLGMFNQLETTTENADNENLFEYDGEKGNLTEGTKYQNPTFTVFENGEKVTYEINQDMYDALRPKNEIFSKWDNTKLMKTTRKINDFRRGILTEYNPAFSITNAIKDAQDVLMNSQHAGKTYAKFPEAYSQILKKGYWYKEYVQNGGSQNSYFTDGDFVKKDSKAKSIIKMPLEAISNINNVIEMSPRLAEYIASREQGKSIQSAMLDASRVTTNFKAGGDVTKFLNRNGATFLNASVQGLQQNIRNIREANAKGLKGYGILLGKAVIASLPALILNNLVWRDDDDYEELQDYVKDNYYIIAKIGDHKFLRIPKGRTVAVIQKAVTNMSDFITNKDEIDPDKYSEVIWGDLKDTFELASNNLAPNNPIENNIVSPIVQAVSNKTWYGEDLVPTRLQEKPNEEKYDESTAEISKQISGILNKIGINSNPMQINYLLDQYGGGVSDVFLPMGTPQAENNMLEDKFTTDSVMKSRYPGEFFEQKDKLAVNRNSSKATDEDELLYKYANSVSGELSDLYQEKREIQNSSLTDKEKKKQIAEVQRQINSITEKALQDLKEPKIKDNTATIGNTEYIKTLNAKTGENEWKKLTDKTKIEGVSLKTQADYENRLAKYKQKTGDTQLSDKEETQIILDGNYTSQEKKAIYLSTTGKKDDLYKAVSNNMNIDEYLGYKTANIQGTKDSSGKTISGTKKTAQLDYINNNISGYENRLLLMGKDYKLSRSQQQDLSAYIDTLDNAEELYTMFDKNFTVKSSSSLGQYGKGNIDLYNRPIVTNSDGSISTVRSMSFEENGKEILIPTVVNGRVVSDDEAIDHYHRTGEYLGKFNSVKEADDYAEKLHEDQEKMYSSGGRTTGYTVYYK